MNPRVLGRVDGDISRVNVDPAWMKRQTAGGALQGRTTTS
jgi:hypothetical protein